MQEKFSEGEEWEAQKIKDWSKVVVSVSLQRAPHLARAIVQDCGGVVVRDADANDQRHLTSSVEVRVTSYAVLLRLVRLPAVLDVSVYEPSNRRIKHPEPFMMEDL